MISFVAYLTKITTFLGRLQNDLDMTSKQIIIVWNVNSFLSI